MSVNPNEPSPSQGRIVLYQDTTATWPAIITRVRLADGDGDWRERRVCDLQVFSPETIYSRQGVPKLNPHEEHSDTPDRWYWPPRVP